MPFIQAKVSTKLETKQEQELKSRLGKAIRVIPGKSEQWLMVALEGEQHIFFRGDDSEPCAFVDVKIYGGEDPVSFDKMTGEITRIFSDILGIAPDHIYVAYEPISSWGWNGNNF